MNYVLYRKVTQSKERRVSKGLSEFLAKSFAFFEVEIMLNNFYNNNYEFVMHSLLHHNVFR